MLVKAENTCKTGEWGSWLNNNISYFKFFIFDCLENWVLLVLCIGWVGEKELYCRFLLVSTQTLCGPVWSKFEKELEMVVCNLCYLEYHIIKVSGGLGLTKLALLNIKQEMSFVFVIILSFPFLLTVGFLSPLYLGFYWC